MTHERRRPRTPQPLYRKPTGRGRMWGGTVSVIPPYARPRGSEGGHVFGRSKVVESPGLGSNHPWSSVTPGASVRVSQCCRRVRCRRSSLLMPGESVSAPPQQDRATSGRQGRHAWSLSPPASCRHEGTRRRATGWFRVSDYGCHVKRPCRKGTPMPRRERTRRVCLGAEGEQTG